MHHSDVNTLTGLALFLGASASYAALVWLLARGHRLSCATVFAAAAVLALVAISIKPLFSNDLWAYSTYGRIFSIHHASPYVAAPASFPHDPAFLRMSRAYGHTRSVYGPIFTLISGAGMLLFRTPLGMRLFFQGLAAAGVLGALALIWRATKDPAAMALLGLHPVIVTGVINGGHNDPLIGVAFVGAILLARRKSHALAGVLAGLASLVKISSLLGVGALALWAWRRRGLRAGLEAGGAGLGVTLVGYFAFGGMRALNPVLHAQRFISRTSVWRTIPQGALPKVGMHLAVPVVVLLAVWWAWREHDLTTAVTLGLAAYLLAGAYILPWYIVWVLPLFALGVKWDLRAGAAALGVLFQLSYFPIPDETGGSVHGASLFVLHAVQLLLVAVLLVRAALERDRVIRL